MSNLATLQTAPPFTTANAREMGRRGALASAESARKRIRREIMAELSETLNSSRPKIEPEINRVVKAMAKLPVTSDDYARLAAILDKLWSKAFPTQAAVKAKPQRDRPSVASTMSETPQEPPAGS